MKQGIQTNLIGRRVRVNQAKHRGAHKESPVGQRYDDEGEVTVVRVEYGRLLLTVLWDSDHVLIEWSLGFFTVIGAAPADAVETAAVPGLELISDSQFSIGGKRYTIHTKCEFSDGSKSCDVRDDGGEYVCHLTIYSDKSGWAFYCGRERGHTDPRRAAAMVLT